MKTICARLSVGMQEEQAQAREEEGMSHPSKPASRLFRDCLRLPKSLCIEAMWNSLYQRELALPPRSLDRPLRNTYIARPPERVSRSFQAREKRRSSLRRAVR